MRKSNQPPIATDRTGRFIVIDIDNFLAGNICPVVAYLWTFVTSTEYAPDLLKSYASVKDIQNRVRREAPRQQRRCGL